MLMSEIQHTCVHSMSLLDDESVECDAIANCATFSYPDSLIDDIFNLLYVVQFNFGNGSREGGTLCSGLGEGFVKRVCAL